MALRGAFALFPCLELFLFDFLLLVVVLGGVGSAAVLNFLVARVRADLNGAPQVPGILFRLLANKPVCKLGVHVGVIADGDLHRIILLLLEAHRHIGLATCVDADLVTAITERLMALLASFDELNLELEVVGGVQIQVHPNACGRDVHFARGPFKRAHFLECRVHFEDTVGDVLVLRGGK